MSASLVGSEMCIRDSVHTVCAYSILATGMCSMQYLALTDPSLFGLHLAGLCADGWRRVAFWLRRPALGKS
eukprot:13352321-Alexandrium_andersonii.AAC.1